MKEESKIVTAGRKFEDDIEIVNPPVYHASTVLLPNAKALKQSDLKYSYGRRGSPASFAFKKALAELEGGYDAVLTPSGLAAISTALLSFVSAGDHILVTDSCYAPTRRFCNLALKPLGVETTFYDPTIGAGIADLFQGNTRIVFCESPGSQTFEVQDIPAIAAVAHEKGTIVIADNTWASPYFMKPFALGADVAIQAITKYVGGHSDLLMGAVSTTEAHLDKVVQMHGLLGSSVGPDDVYLAQRGLRTLAVRMDRHYENALIVAKWLEARPEVERVLYPALESHPQHNLWRRDFSGASGLLSVVLKHPPGEAVDAMVDSYKLFGIGFSFGGYESLAITINPAAHRTATKWDTSKAGLRYHIGLEDPEDLIADLENGFKRLAKGPS